MRILSITLLIVLTTSCMLEQGRSPDEIMPNHATYGNSVEPTPEPTIPIRPDGALFIADDFCACISQKTDLITDVCANYCAGAPKNTTPTLYGSVSTGAAFSEFEEINNLYEWCTVELYNELGQGQTSPTCYFRVTDKINTYDLAINIPSGSNSFTVNLSTLDTNKVYLGSIVEVKSGSTSDSIQIQRRDQEETSESFSGPLMIMPMSQYSCLTRSGAISESGDEFYDKALRLHYYYASNEKPDALPPGDQMTICHDPRLPGQGDNDNQLYDRFELVEHAFYVWNKSDLRFYDVSPSNGKLDVNDLIEEKLSDVYNITQEINIFQQFKWPNGPLATDATFSGYHMQPWINTTTGRGYCPGFSEYNSGDPLFAILREILGGIETEGIFIAIREAEIMYDSDGNQVNAPDDILFVRESDLKKVWFYYEYNSYYTPTEITAGQKTIHFYYPFDETQPFVKKSDQKLYTVRAPEEINSTSTSTDDLRTSITSPDKRFGCVPKQEL